MVATINGAPVRVRDIGRAEDGTKEQRSAVRVNGVPTVILEVRRQSGENTVAVIEAVKANLARLAPVLPADVKVDIIRDQSRYIYAALHEINLHLVLGSILASLVVFAFMRSWRSTVIAAVAIPASVISAFGMMWALGFTLNSVTMLALVLMVGIVIDDAIVVLENIFRFVEEKRMPPFEAARAATADIGLAVMATTLLPGGHLRARVVHVVGLRPLPLPVRAHGGRVGAGEPPRVVHAHAHDERPDAPRRRTRWASTRRPARGAGSTAGSTRTYAWLLRLAITPVGRVVVALVALAVIASSVPLYGMVKREYVPTDVDEAEFEMFYEGPEGISLAAMDEAVQAMSREIQGVRGVRLALLTAGGNFLGRVNQGGGYVRIAPHSERTVTPARLWEGLRQRRPAGGLPRQLHAARGDAGGPAAPAEVPRHAHHRAERARASTSAAATSTSTTSSAAPTCRRSRRYGEQLRQRAQQIGGMLDLEHHAAPRPAGAPGPGRPGPGGRPPGGRRADRHRPPAHGRRGPGGLPLPRPVPRPGLRRPAASERGRPARPPHHRAAVRLAGLGRRRRPRSARRPRSGWRRAAASSGSTAS